MSERGSNVRRGAIAIAAAKAWFLCAGLAQNVVTPIVIGQESFGTFKRALAFVNVLNNVVVVASIQGVSRAVAASPEVSRGATVRRALLVHGALGVALALLLTSLVPLIVAHQHAPQLAAPLHLLAIVLIAYGIYAPLVGALNGVGSFGRQATLDATYSTLRTILIAGCGAWFVHARLGGGAVGACVGFVATAVFILPFAYAWAPRGRGTTTFDARAHLAFLFDLSLAQLFQSLVLQIDIVLLGRAATLRALQTGMSDEAARAAADRLAGVYAQAQAFGLVPYQILLAAAYVLFPAIAAARARGDSAAIRDEVARGGRTTLVAAGAVVAAVAGAPLAVLRFAFGRGGEIPIDLVAPTLRHLAVGHGATAIAMVGVTLFAAAGWGRRAAGLAAVVALFATLGAWLFGRTAQLADAHMASLLSLGLGVGLIVGAAVVVLAVHRAFGPFVSLPTLLRVAFALTVALVVGPLVPLPAMRLLCALPPVVPLIVYLCIVAVLGEPVKTWVLGHKETMQSR